MNSEKLAWEIRKHSIDMVHDSHASHIGAALSAADILAVLYSEVLNIDPKCPDDDKRDRFIMSKGHAGAAVYSVLAEKGFFPVERLSTYYQNGSDLSGHISHKNVPGVEVSTGSLGHGCVMACGMAMAAKSSKKTHNIYTLVGDGECNEGSVWEMALIASKFKLDNFTVIVDRNRMQAMGFCEDIMPTSPMGSKWESFGWSVIEVKDGNCHEELKQAFTVPVIDKPKCIIANTVKGKGVSFMENNLLWHYRDPQNEFYERAINELEACRP